MVIDVFAGINWYAIVITFCFIGLDFVSGFAQAISNKEVSSEKLRKGLFHKCGFMLAIVLGILCEISMRFIDLGFDFPICIAVCGYIILAELVSILENIGKLSPGLADSGFLQIFKVHNQDSEGE